MNWFCAYKSQEEGEILTHNLKWKTQAGARFWTCNLLTHIFKDLQPLLSYRIRHFMAPHSWALSSATFLQLPTSFRNKVQTSHSPVLVGQEQKKIPSCLPLKYHPDPVLLSFTVQIETGVFPDGMAGKRSFQSLMNYGIVNKMIAQSDIELLSLFNWRQKYF